MNDATPRLVDPRRSVAPAVAVSAVALAVWGFVGTTAAGLLAVLVAIATRLPRPYTAWEFFLLALGAFLWFVTAPRRVGRDGEFGRRGPGGDDRQSDGEFGESHPE